MKFTHIPNPKFVLSQHSYPLIVNSPENQFHSEGYQKNGNNFISKNSRNHTNCELKMIWPVK